MALTSGNEEELLTVDELASVTGLTVRTTRYYAGLGLLPPPLRRGRVAYYSAQHRARLELVRALQDHGFTLSAIEKYLARLPHDASEQDLALQRVMLTSWVAGPPEVVSRRQLDVRAGRRLDDDQVERLVSVLAVRRIPAAGREGPRFELQPSFDIAVRGLDLEIPVDSMVAANRAITRHMDALADELTVILKEQVLSRRLNTEEEKVRFEATLEQLRQLTLELVVTGFRRAGNDVIARSLTRS